MRIAVIGPTFPYRGGIAHHTTLLVRHLREQHSVDFISFKSQYPGWLFPGKTDRDPSTDTLAEPCEYILSPMDPISWIRTAYRVRNTRPDLVILPWWIPFWAPAWFVVAFLASIGRTHRTVFVCHNVFPHERHWWDRPLAHLALSRGDQFIVHSQQDADHLLSLFPIAKYSVSPLPTFGIGGGDTVSKDVARQQLGLLLDQPVLLFFGFVRPYKGLDVLLDAMPLVMDQLPTAHLLIVGEMWKDKTEYLAQIERLGIADNLTIVDQYVPNEELGLYFGAADVVVLPYRSATQSAVVQLAFAYGKPVITTNVGGLAEAVVDGVNGLVVAAGDSRILKQAILRFFASDLKVTSKTKVSRTQDLHSWEIYTHGLLSTKE